MDETWDIVVVGAGAAGCAAALAARGALRADGSLGPPAADAPRVLLLDGQDRPGRKILISGGGRCNATNARVRPDDFVTSQPRMLRTQLLEFGVEEVRTMFDGLGVPLAEEPLGKLFPAEGRRARDVVEALDRALTAAGVRTRYGVAVDDVARTTDDGWVVRAGASAVTAGRVVLATGGRSVPATGSTGFGLDLAVRLGHRLTTPVPALAALHARQADEQLAGLAVPAIVLARDATSGTHVRVTAGSLLFTHRGHSGPAALDVSEVVERSDTVEVVADLWSLHRPDGAFARWLDAPKLPGACLADPPPPASVTEVDDELRSLLDAAERGATLASVLRSRLPRRLVDAVVEADGGTPAGNVSRELRGRTALLLAQWPLRVAGTAGYAKAEVTAGGVRLDELDRRTLASRVVDGLHLCGEVCDVTGRLGGFNFQWAWTSGFLAGRGAAAALDDHAS